MSSRYEYALLAPKRLIDAIRVVWGMPRSQPLLVITPPQKVRYG